MTRQENVVFDGFYDWTHFVIYNTGSFTGWGGLCLFLGGYLGGTYRVSEGIAKESEGQDKGWRVVGCWVLGEESVKNHELR